MQCELMTDQDGTGDYAVKHIHKLVKSHIYM